MRGVTTQRGEDPAAVLPEGEDWYAHLEPRAPGDDGPGLAAVRAVASGAGTPRPLNTYGSGAYDPPVSGRHGYGSADHAGQDPAWSGTEPAAPHGSTSEPFGRDRYGAASGPAGFGAPRAAAPESFGASRAAAPEGFAAHSNPGSDGHFGPTSDSAGGGSGAANGSAAGGFGESRASEAEGWGARHGGAAEEFGARSGSGADGRFGVAAANGAAFEAGERTGSHRRVAGDFGGDGGVRGETAGGAPGAGDPATGRDGSGGEGAPLEGAEAAGAGAARARWSRRERRLRAAAAVEMAAEAGAFDPGDTGTWRVRDVVPGADGGRRNTTILRYLLGLLAVDHVRTLTRWTFAVPVVGLVLLLVTPLWLGLAVLVLGVLLILGRILAIRMIERRSLARRYRPVEEELRAAVESGKANLRGELRRVGMPHSPLALPRSVVRLGSSDSRTQARSQLRDIEIDRVLPRAQLDRALRVLDEATTTR